MPIVVWGNGACRADGTWFQEFRQPLSAHGVLVIASGLPGGSGTTDSDMLIDAIDWAVAENGRAGSKYFGRLDTDAITAMGQSCGGLEAIDASSDPRVASTVLWNSGIFATGGIGGVDKSALNELHAPVGWFTGGTSDIAYSNAVDDYQRVPSDIPAVLGHYDNVGHTGLFTDRRRAPHRRRRRPVARRHALRQRRPRSVRRLGLRALQRHRVEHAVQELVVGAPTSFGDVIRRISTDHVTKSCESVRCSPAASGWPRPGRSDPRPRPDPGRRRRPCRWPRPRNWRAGCTPVRPCRHRGCGWRCPAAG